MERIAWPRPRAGLHRVAPAHPPKPPGPSDEAAAADADLPPRGCGWFDSSHELRAGLAVIEHEVIDVVVASPRPRPPRRLGA